MGTVHHCLRSVKRMLSFTDSHDTLNVDDDNGYVNKNKI